jgi:hypothetical protein
MAKERVNPSEVMSIPEEGKFKALVKQVTAAESDKNESVGRIGSLISQAVEKNHLDKKAFAMFRAMKRMSPSKYNTTKSHFDHYCEIWGLNELGSAQAELVERTETDPALKTAAKGKKAKAEKTPKAKKGTEPRPGSFAEKMKTAQSKIPPASDAFPEGPSEATGKPH